MVLDLSQTKLTRAEWDSIETPVSQQEREILRLLIDGYANPDIKTNKTMSMYSFLKIEQSPETSQYLYQKYFDPILQKFLKKYKMPAAVIPSIGGGALKKMRSIDLARIQNMEANIEQNKDVIFEFLLIDVAKQMCKYLGDGKSKYSRYLYSLVQLKKTSIQAINPNVQAFIDTLVQTYVQQIDMYDIIRHAYEFIERNDLLLAYEDRQLYDHQKHIFSVFRQKDDTPKLVLYIAPTGTGKTMTPLALAQDGMRVIFICAARHIGLALAKAAISMEKKIGFAFGCETASDIRLHYFAASVFTKDKRSGRIRKVDNDRGEKVEIMICDLKSYLVAQNYMRAFNPSETIITYWDEPTISLDYAEHPLHQTIHEIWSKNLIPNLVLSCATLPSEAELMPCIMDFTEKFPGAQVHNVTSYDCKKSIPIVNKDGHCVLPHYLFGEFAALRRCVDLCDKNRTLLRYFDLKEIVEFVLAVATLPIDDSVRIESYFRSIDDITMISIKLYYLELLKRMDETMWTAVREMLAKTARKSHFAKKSTGILVTTDDAHTLTDGPTIYLCEDVAKIGHFYIQQSAIPNHVFDEILRKITRNNKLSDSIAKLEETLETLENKQTTSGDGSKKAAVEDDRKPPEIRKLYKEIDGLRAEIRYISIDPLYIPNSKPHQEKWTGDVSVAPFVPSIDEQTVRTVMSLDVEPYLKVLLLLGIGLFMEGAHPKYLEVMKALAYEQHLYMIIASSDYIYGTNYSFCHGFLGKDLTQMTQQKTMQCLGRIGRGAVQQNYTVRFRDDRLIMQLFTMAEHNLEAENMCRLFQTDPEHEDLTIE